MEMDVDVYSIDHMIRAFLDLGWSFDTMLELEQEEEMVHYCIPPVFEVVHDVEDVKNTGSIVVMDDIVFGQKIDCMVYVDIFAG